MTNEWVIMYRFNGRPYVQTFSQIDAAFDTYLRHVENGHESYLYSRKEDNRLYTIHEIALNFDRVMYR